MVCSQTIKISSIRIGRGMESKQVILEAQNLSHEVEGAVIVNDISVKVFEGDALGVVGPSGAGKSSFLRLLNRLDEPTSGTVFLNGEDYREIPPEVLRRKVGMVMQQPFLFPGTVAENIRFGPKQRGEELPDEAVEQLLNEMDMGGFAGRDVSALSGGEAQRVSLARALANSPDLLLLDEPTSALDEDARMDVERLINKVLRNQGIPYVIVTHDLDQAVRVAERVMVIEKGRMVRIGPAGEVLNANQVV